MDSNARNPHGAGPNQERRKRRMPSPQPHGKRIGNEIDGADRRNPSHETLGTAEEQEQQDAGEREVRVGRRKRGRTASGAVS